MLFTTGAGGTFAPLLSGDAGWTPFVPFETSEAKALALSAWFAELTGILGGVSEVDDAVADLDGDSAEAAAGMITVLLLVVALTLATFRGGGAVGVDALSDEPG
jgi:hypothetical protein